MNDNSIVQIQAGINARQQELNSVTDRLARVAQQASQRAAMAKVTLILLGAFAASREAASSLFGVDSNAVVIMYTFAALLIAVVAGLEAAFKWESRSVELRVLAASAQSTVRLVDSQWHKEVGSATIEERLSAAKRILDIQDTKLADLQEKAAALGVNITLEIRELFHGQTLYPA